jgi:hypothetical protein
MTFELVLIRLRRQRRCRRFLRMIRRTDADVVGEAKSRRASRWRAIFGDDERMGIVIGPTFGEAPFVAHASSPGDEVR